MAEYSRIADYFWGDQGFETVDAWMNQTKDSTTYLAYFMRERAAIEEMYASRLAQLLKSTATMVVEVGSTREAWLAIRGETDNMCNNARTMAQTLVKDCEKPLSKFKDNQLKLKKQYVNDALRVIRENDKLADRFARAKKQYEKWAADTDAASAAAEAARSSSPNVVKPSEMHKAQQKEQRLARETLQYEREAAEAARQLSAFQALRADKLASVYNSLQQQEEERIDFIRQHLIKFVTALEASSGYLPLACARMRDKVEAITPQVDIEQFIREKQTSTHRPSESDVEFSPSRKYDIVAAGAGDRSSSSGPSSSADYESPFASRASLPSSAAPPTAAAAAAGGSGPRRARALFDYVGADQHELDLLEGDLIEVIDMDESSGWYTGILGSRTGLFPSNYCELIE